MAVDPALVRNFDAPKPPQLPQRAGVVQRLQTKVKTQPQLLALRVAGVSEVPCLYLDRRLQHEHLLR